MADTLGASFLPGADQGLNQGQVPGGLSPQAQQAIQFLSLRLPTVAGAQALSPQALLQSNGAHLGTNHDLASAVVRSVLAAFGHVLPPGGASGAGGVLGGNLSAGGDPGLQPNSGDIPAPRITPGETGSTPLLPTPPMGVNPTPQAPTVQEPPVKGPTADMPIPAPMGGGSSLGPSVAVPDDPRGLGRSFS